MDNKTEEELEIARKEYEEKINELKQELVDSNQELAASSEKLRTTVHELATSKEELNQTKLLIGPDGEKLGSWRVTAVNNLGIIITGVITVIVVLALIAFFYDGDDKNSGANILITQLTDPSAARGLITFVLVMGTVIMGLLLLVSSFRTAPGAAESFTRGKEIFTILVGILGTIVGFYFGLESERDANSELVPNQVNEVVVADPKTDPPSNGE